MIILKIIGFIAAFLVVGFIVLWFKHYLIPKIEYKRSMFLHGIKVMKMAKKNADPHTKKTLKEVGRLMIKIALGL